VVLCSSGAIGVGLRRMGLKERGKGLSHKQVSGNDSLSRLVIVAPAAGVVALFRIRIFWMSGYRYFTDTSFVTSHQSIRDVHVPRYAM
jgi:hypothetical protein